MNLRRLIMSICVASCLLFTSAAIFAQTKSAAAPGASSVYPIQEGFVDAHGVLIYYTTIGRGAPLVIVHGGPGASHDYFLPYLLPLARQNKLIFIDERGSGRSEKLEDPKGYTVENMVEDVEAVRTGLGLGKIALLGHSYGGVLAQAYALKYQQNLTQLILCSTFSSTPPSTKSSFAWNKTCLPNCATALKRWKPKDYSAMEKTTRRIATPMTT